ncbi:MAG TPA: heme exporter protein CcmB [Candidatus Acidoferrales bacterium]|jgi:heme exporter protein B|nr:heme exporter protein CcmB [Candidatus Acidoferrales bacterium]
MGTSRAAAILLAKELRLEFRTREILTATVMFSLVVIVLFSYVIEPTATESRRYGPGLLWIAFLFAGSLMLHPSFAREQANDTLDALRMTPISPFAIVLGKLLANFVFLSLTELVLVPAFAVLYNLSLAGIVWRLIVVLVLGTFGLVTTGTVFSAISAQARMRELLLPLLLLPFLAPMLIAAAEATTTLFSEQPVLDRTWVSFLAGFDVVFFVATWLLCNFLIQE